MPAPLRTRRGACRSAVPSLSTIAEEEEGQRSRRKRRRGGGGMFEVRIGKVKIWCFALRGPELRLGLLRCLCVCKF